MDRTEDGTVDRTVDRTLRMNKELISRINGSAWSATKYRDHIRKIVKDNYTKENMVADVPSAEKLLELVL